CPNRCSRSAPLRSAGRKAASRQLLQSPHSWPRTGPVLRRRGWPMNPLGGKVAVVAGATRGAGRGIARALGEAGATVYCTGRSVRGKPSSYGRPETIDETAEMIVSSGGAAVAVRVDHTVESEVEALFARVEREHAR